MTMWDPDGAGPRSPCIVLAGSFTSVAGGSAANIAMWDGLGWEALGSGIGSPVFALAVLPTGELVAGGSFATAGGNPAKFIAKWNGTSWLPLGEGMNANVQSLAVLANGDLVAGGLFTTAGTMPAQGLARWNGTTWSGFGTEAGCRAYALASLPNGDLLAGGYFASNGMLLRWNGSEWLPFAPGLASTGTVFALAVLNDGGVVAGGQFTTANGAPSNHIARWDGTNWTGLGGGMGESPSAAVQAVVALPNGDVVATGNFSTSGGTAASNIAKWDGATWSQLETGLDKPGSSMLVRTDGQLVVGGQFSSAGRAPARGIARWDGQAWSPLGSWATGSVHAIAQTPDGAVIAAGDFAWAGDQTVAVARWSGAKWTPLGRMRSVISPRIVSALAVLSNGDLVAGGEFFQADGTTMNRIARWSGDAWKPLGIGIEGTGVYALLVLPNGDLIAAGKFTKAGGVPAANIARWDGQAWSAFAPGLSGTVYALQLLPNGHVVAAGSLVVGSSRPATALWDGNQWRSMPTDPVSLFYPSTGFALQTLPDGNLFCGGEFQPSIFVPIGLAGAWDGTTWSFAGSNFSSSAKSVYALASSPSGKLVAAGSFEQSFSGGTAKNIAVWDGLEWSPLGTGIAKTVLAVKATANGELIAGTDSGYQMNLGPNSKPLLRWTENPKPWIAEKPLALTVGKHGAISIRSTPAIGFRGVAYRWRRNGSDLVNGPGGASAGGGSVSGASGLLESPTTGFAATLTITNSQPSDTGDYTIVFANACGGSSATAEVVVQGCASDLNGDDLVDDSDFIGFVGAYNVLDCADPSMPQGCPADLNHDGVVDDADFTVFVRAYDELICEP